AIASDRAIADHDAELEQLTSDPFRAPQSVLARHGHDQLSDLGTEMRPATSGAGLPAPEHTPALPMPAHHGIGCDDAQMLAPAGIEPARQDPEQLVPGVKPGTRWSPSRTGQDSQLMAQQQVLKYKVLARP